MLSCFLGEKCTLCLLAIITKRHGKPPNYAESLALASEPVKAAVSRLEAEGATMQEEHEAATKQYEEVATELQAKLVKKTAGAGRLKENPAFAGAGKPNTLNGL